MLEQGVRRTCANVRVEGFTGLITDFCRERGRPGDRQGPALGHRLRLRAADGADEPHLTGVETVFVPDRTRSTASSPRAWSRRSRRSAATCPAWCPDFVHVRSRPAGEREPAIGPLRATDRLRFSVDLIVPDPEVNS